VGEAGIEPTTTGLEGRCSIQLSYSPGGGDWKAQLPLNKRLFPFNLSISSVLDGRGYLIERLPQ
jgi:hypothetical protein